MGAETPAAAPSSRSSLPSTRADVRSQLYANRLLDGLLLQGRRAALSWEVHPYQKLVAFYDDFVDKALDAGADLEQFASWFEGRTLSTAFSGIGAPETALRCFALVVQARMPERQARVNSGWFLHAWLPPPCFAAAAFQGLEFRV